MNSESRPLWSGRGTALLGILLLALNLRTSVTVLSPIISLVVHDVPFGGIGLGVLGTLPPIAFAASGIIAPMVARRIGLENSLVVACVAMIVGPIVRAVSPNYGSLVLGSAIAFAGIGFGNILLPPLVKKFFPDRIGQVTAAYATLISISISAPPLLAIQAATGLGWRTWVALWAVLAALALVPWILLSRNERRSSRVSPVGERTDALPQVNLLSSVRHSRIAIAIGLAFAVSAVCTYAFFAWLPEMLQDIAGSTPAEAGALLALFGIVGLPLSIITPVLATRLRNVSVIIFTGVACFVVGYLGLLLVPTVVTWLWVVMVGFGSIMFPLCLALIGLRTRKPGTAVAVSGIVQAIGYTAGASGPLLFGVLHVWTHGWSAPLLFLMAVALVGIVPAIVLAKPRFVDDELIERSQVTSSAR